MWILADWLEEYRPQLKIQDGKRTLRNARLYSDGLKAERSTVFIGYASDFISLPHCQIICANGHDIMILDTDDLYEVLNKVFDAFDYYNSWSDMLNEKIKTDSSLIDLLNDSESVFNCMMQVADASYYVYAQTGTKKYASEDVDLQSIQTERIMTLNSIMAINQDKRIRLNNPQTYLQKIPQPGQITTVAVRNLFFHGQHRGWLITDDRDGNITNGDIDVQDELGDIIERWIEYHQSQRELVEKSGVLLQILENLCVKGEDGYRRVESLGWRRSDELQVYVFQNDTDSSSFDHLIDHRLEKIGQGFAFQFEGRLLFVLNNSLTLLPQFETELRDLLIKVDCFCGRSPRFFDIFELRENFELAVIVSNFSNSPDRIREIESSALPYYYTLIAKNDKAHVAHAALKVLQQYDLKHSTELYLTLKIYLQCERNYIKAAEALHIHRNSLIYRVRRIEELTGLTLESFEARQYILLSYEIENFRD